MSEIDKALSEAGKGLEKKARDAGISEDLIALAKRRGQQSKTEPQIKTVTIDVCTFCLQGWGAECHTPGCAFWMCEVPPFEIAQRLAYAEESKCYEPDPMSQSENQPT